MIPSQKSLLEYRKRIQQALSYIVENLDRPLSLNEVAQSASFSEYHFHRIFSALMNEAPGEYITRKKLEKAAMKLAYSQGATVSQVATEFGYSSVSSFSKAFNQWFGIRPSEITQVRQKLDAQGGKLQTRYEKSIEAEQIFAGVSEEEQSNRFSMIDSRVEVKPVDGFQLYCLTSPGGYELESIRNTWKELNERLEDAKIEMCERFAISHDHPGLTPQERCRYDACVALSQDQDHTLDLPTAKVPSGRYAVFSAEGPEASILGQYLEFYTFWMPGSGYEPDNFPVLEHYLPATREGWLKVELWAKINRLSYL